MASSQPLDTVYFLSSVGLNDSGTLIVPDKVIKELNEDFTTYVVKYKENIDKRKIETLFVRLGYKCLFPTKMKFECLI